MLCKRICLKLDEGSGEAGRGMLQGQNNDGSVAAPV